MEIEEEDYNSYQPSQIQMQDKLQLLRQKQDMVSCNNCFGMLLSSMESLFIKNGYKIPMKFDHYNYFDNRKWKTKDQIKSQLYTDLMGYKLSKMAYVQKYGKFDYPDYPPIEKIIDIILKWKEITKDSEEKKLCEEILDLILDKNQKSLSYYQTRIEKSSNTSVKADPTKQLELSSKIHDKLDVRDEKVKEKLKKNPKAKFGLKMKEEEEEEEEEEENEKDELSKSMNCSSENEVEINNELKKQEKKITAKMKDLLNLSRKLSNDKIEAKDIKGSLENTEKIINDYYKANKDIKFLFKQIHRDNVVKEMDRYISLFKSKQEKKKIFERIKKLLTKYDYL